MECLKRKWLKRMKTYKLPSKPKEIKARLHLNENPFPPPEGVVQAALEAAKNGNLYPDPERLWKLRELAANYYNLPGPEWVLPTLGSDTALRLAFECCALMGKARLPYPSFQAYPPLLEATGAELSYYNLEVKENKFILNLDEFAKERADMAVIDTPNNPTGSVLVEESDLEILSSSFPAILIDEAYGEFAPKVLTPLVQNYKNVVVTRTMSKAFALAGFRIGYLISNPKNIEEFSKMLLPYDIPSCTIEAAIAAFNNKEYVLKYIDYVNKEKRRLMQKIDEVGWRAFESHTNFVLIKAFKGAADELIKRGIMVRKVPLGDEWMRVSIGKKEEMDLFYDAIESIARSKTY